MSPARAKLIELNARIEPLESELATLREPLARYRSVIEGEQIARADYERRAQRHNAEIEGWIAAGCPADRPAAPATLVEAERDYAQALANAGAARRLTTQVDSTIAETSRRLDLARAPSGTGCTARRSPRSSSPISTTDSFRRSHIFATSKNNAGMSPTP